MKKLFQIGCMAVVLVLMVTSCGNFIRKQQKPSEQTGQPKEEQADSKAREEGEEPSDQAGTESKPETEELFAGARVVKPDYDKIVNQGTFTGFTDNQLTMLKENGFVVLEPAYDNYPYKYMHNLYEEAAYSGTANYLTTDAVLDLYHIFYGGSLKGLEMTYYYNYLGEITNLAVADLLKHYQSAEKEVRHYYDKLLAYFVTGGRLLHTDEQPLVERENWVFSKAGQGVRKQIETNQLKWQELAAQIPESAIKLSNQEYQLIGAAVGITQSPIFGFDNDYSQYKVRGHYTSNQYLERYFKSMMWYSQVGFNVTGQDVDSYRCAILMSALLLDNQELAAIWQKLYDITSLYSGKSNALDFRDMEKLITAVYGQKATNLINQSQVEVLFDPTFQSKIEEAIKQLPDAKIKVKTFAGSEHNLSTERQLRFMGQRFTADAYIMSELINPPVRTNITSFDVFTVFGNKKAKQILYEYYQPEKNWPEYGERLAQITDEYNTNKETMFSDDMYHGWLDCIEATLNPMYGTNIPYFLTTEAYQYKNINAALGGFTQLKHDNVLYSQQVMAEAGGPDGKPPLHYLEPNIKLYQRMDKLVAASLEVLLNQGIEQENIIQPLYEIKRYTEVFVRIAQKELDNQMLTAEELEMMGTFGGMVDYVKNAYDHHAFDIGLSEEMNENQSSSIITDIATVVGRGYLSIGVGLPYEIYVLAHVNGQDILAKGVIYSSYEFFSDQRLTDEQWQQMVGVELNYGQAAQYEETKLTKVMPYAAEFVSTEPNHVTVDWDLEIDWPEAD